MALGGKREGAGRKKGVPNKATAGIRALAHWHGPDAIMDLLKLMRSDDERVRLGAIKEMLDRGYGKAPQAHTGEDGEGPMKLEVLHPSIQAIVARVAGADKG